MKQSEKNMAVNKTESSVYSGWIRHRRFEPVKNAFTYPIFMLYLDLDEIKNVLSKKWYFSIERFNFVSFKRKDFFKPEMFDLKQAVISEVSEYYKQEGVALTDIISVRMLCHVRYLGLVFNPVVFYYCFDANNEPVAILAEITNTPWGERHSYVLPICNREAFSGLDAQQKGHNLNNRKHQFKFKKCFHVSPFNPMNMDYRWVFSEAKEQLVVHMENFIQTNDGAKHFDATLNLEQHDLVKNLARILMKQPFMTAKVMLGIYWQAFKLWVKGSKFYDHPGTPDSNIDGTDIISEEVINKKTETL